MKRIETILGNYGVLFKLILAIFWIFWATNFYIPLRKVAQEEINYQKNRNLQTEIQKTIELRNYAHEKGVKAEKKGIAYTPQEYFKDLKDIHEREQQDKISLPRSELGKIWEISLNNLKKGYWDKNEVEAATSVYSEWLQGGGRTGEKTREGVRREISQSFKENGWLGALRWFLIFYQKSILLALLLYLVRMANRKGIFETILADKRKFLLATIGWVFFIHKYPFNVIREIRVEAELRRLGRFWRRLTLQERNSVREIANISYYREWLLKYRLKHSAKFQRGLLLAFALTLIFHLLFNFSLLSLSEASEKKVRTSPIVVINSATRGAIQEIQTEMHQNQNLIKNKFWPENWVIPPALPKIAGPSLTERLKELLEEMFYKIVAKKIDHIPLSPLGFEVINQVGGRNCFLRQKKGGNNEIFKCGHSKFILSYGFSN